MRVGEIFTVIPSFLLVLIITATLKPRIREWVIWIEDNSFVDGLMSSGFKLISTHSDVGTGGETYMYLAFAEAPFKYANAYE